MSKDSNKKVPRKPAGNAKAKQRSAAERSGSRPGGKGEPRRGAQGAKYGDEKARQTGRQTREELSKPPKQGSGSSSAPGKNGAGGRGGSEGGTHRGSGPQKRERTPARTGARSRPAEHTDRPASRSKDARKKRPGAARIGSGRRSSAPAAGSLAPAEKPAGSGSMRLNRYLSNAGIASRREADELIKSGLVEVNGVVVTEMGSKVQPGDVVKYAGERLTAEKPAYILLNKPRGYAISPRASRQGLHIESLLKSAGKFHLRPVGKMDRNASGLVLLTNDMHLATKLSHPGSKVRKLYHVFLDKNLKPEHLALLSKGVELEHGFVAVDELSWVEDAKDKSQVGIALHSTKARAVRELFEQLHYKVVKLDRVSFAGLTKKDLPRGRWRALSERELQHLQML